MMRWMIVLALTYLAASGCGGKTEAPSDSQGGSGGGGGSSGSGGTSAKGGNGGYAGVVGKGGSGPGGSSGSAGSGGSSTWARQCKTNSDCSLHTDCCNCLPLASGEQAPTCASPPCTQDTCSSLDVDGVQCVAGQCVLNGDCNSGHANCGSKAPSCDPDSLPTVDLISSCWTGHCVKADLCGGNGVSSCDDCIGKTGLCVRGPYFTHCVDIPPACASNLTCACLEKFVCTGMMANGCVDAPATGIPQVVCKGSEIDGGI